MFKSSINIRGCVYPPSWTRLCERPLLSFTVSRPRPLQLPLPPRPARPSPSHSPNVSSYCAMASRMSSSVVNRMVSPNWSSAEWNETMMKFTYIKWFNYQLHSFGSLKYPLCWFANKGLKSPHLMMQSKNKNNKNFSIICNIYMHALVHLSK